MKGLEDFRRHLSEGGHNSTTARVQRKCKYKIKLSLLKLKVVSQLRISWEQCDFLLLILFLRDLITSWLNQCLLSPLTGELEFWSVGEGMQKESPKV